MLRAAEPALTKSELIAELAASNPHLRQADAELIVVTIFDQITNALAVHNPRTGEPVSVKEKALPFFKAGKVLRGRLNRKLSRPAISAPDVTAAV
jgi:integration host factor subunit beta